MVLVVVCFFCEFASAFGQNVYVSGSAPELGGWDPGRARRMRYWWPWYAEVVFQLPSPPSSSSSSLLLLQLEYKYVVKHDHVPQPPLWEPGPNRTLLLRRRAHNAGCEEDDNATYYVRDTFGSNSIASSSSSSSSACAASSSSDDVRGPEPLELLCVGAALLPKVAPEDFARMGRTLETLRCDRDVAALPECIGALRSLRALYVQFAPLEELPESIGALLSLQLLDASASHLRALPDTIGRLTQLRRLELSGNMLTQLPDSIGLATALVELNVANNELRSVPASLGNLRFLRTLRLGHNHIAEVPAALAFATSLERIELQHNDIAWIPPEFVALARNSLETLDVTVNPRLVGVPAALFFRLGSERVLCNYIGLVEPRLQIRIPSLLDLCLTAISRLHPSTQAEHAASSSSSSSLLEGGSSLLPQDLVAMLREPAKRCDGCGRTVLGRPWIAELFHWAPFSPIGNELGVPLVAIYCTPACMALGRERFESYRDGYRYSPVAASSSSVTAASTPSINPARVLESVLARRRAAASTSRGPQNLLRVSFGEADFLGIPDSPTQLSPTTPLGDDAVTSVPQAPFSLRPSSLHHQP